MAGLTIWSDWIWTVYHYLDKFTFSPFDHLNYFYNRGIRFVGIPVSVRLPDWVWTIGYVIEGGAIACGVALGLGVMRRMSFYCAKCGRWSCGTTDSPPLWLDDPDAVVAALRVNDFSPLFAATVRSEDEDHFEVSLCKCAKCGDAELSLSKNIVSFKDGKPEKNSDELIRDVFCPGESAAALEQFWKTVKDDDDDSGADGENNADQVPMTQVDNNETTDL